MVALLDVALGLGDCRLATPVRAKSVAGPMDRWLIQRLEYQPYGFLHHAVYHVGDPQPTLSTICLWDPYPPDISWQVGSRKLCRSQHGSPICPVLLHLLDALAEEVIKKIKKTHQLSVKVDGNPYDGWQVIDVGEIVVHLFTPDQRAYYKLEELWGEAKVLLHLQ